MSLSWALVATQGHVLGSSHQLMSTHPIHVTGLAQSTDLHGLHPELGELILNNELLAHPPDNLVIVVSLRDGFILSYKVK